MDFIEYGRRMRLHELIDKLEDRLKLHERRQEGQLELPSSVAASRRIAADELGLACLRAKSPSCMPVSNKSSP